MIVCGNDSFTISAACHASHLIVSAAKSPASEGNIESHSLVAGANNDDAASRREGSEGDERELETLETEVLAEVDVRQSQALLQVTRSRVRWGVVQMPPDWYASFQELEDGHEAEPHPTALETW